MQNVKGLV